MIITLIALVTNLITPNRGEIINNMHSSSQEIKAESKISRNFRRKKTTKYKPTLDLSKFREKKAEDNWTGHFSAQNFRKNNFDNLHLKKIKEDLRTSLISLPKKHTEGLKFLEIKNTKNVSRGLSSSSKIILHTDSIQNSQELISVFIHEMGHIVDLGVISGKNGLKTNFYDGETPILSDDLSVDFYTLSWVDANTRKENSVRNDFVSGYAKSDCFEDFAETYLFYRLHGEKFRGILKNSEILKKKYNFMKKNVFENKEFQLSSEVDLTFNNKFFDTTLISFNKDRLESFPN